MALREAIALALLASCTPEVVSEPIESHPATEHARAWFFDYIGEPDPGTPVVWVVGGCIEFSEPRPGCQIGATVTADFTMDRTVYVTMPADGTIASSALFHELVHARFDDPQHFIPLWGEIDMIRERYREQFPW